MIAVDTSAVIAILYEEEDAASYAHAMEEAKGLCMATPTLLECHSVAYGRFGQVGISVVGDFIVTASVDIISFDQGLAKTATMARYRFGKKTGHPAKLNLGDCFSYALAKSRNLPLLFKGDDFVHTDIAPALVTR